MLSWLALAAVVAGPAGTDVTARVRHDGESLIRVAIESRDDLEVVQAAALDVWTEHPRPGLVDVVVDADGMAALGASGLPLTVVQPDIQVPVDQELQRLSDGGGGVAAPGPFFDDYRPLDEVLKFVDALAAERPDLVERLYLGDSLEGRPIIGLRIGTDPSAPGVLLNGCQHAREWISVAVTTCIADTLVHDADVDKQLSSLLDQVSFIVVPVVNPDGYVYTWTTDRFWRKNRRGSFGVDLNRNWGVAWGGDGSSPDPDSGNYHGESAFSEPESSALRDLIEKTPDMTAHIDFHAYGQLILYPWGFGYVEAPHLEILRDLALLMSDVMEPPWAKFYNPIQASDFYPAAGNMPDWTYGARGIYGYTIELRPWESPDEDFTSGFVLPPDEIVPTCEEAMEAVKSLAEFAAISGPGMPGDDGSVTDTGTPFDDLGGWTGDDSGTTDDTGPVTTGGSGNGTSTSSSSTTGPDPTGAAESGQDPGGNLAGDVLAARGCACGLGGDAPTPWLAAPLLVLLRRRRRR